METKYVKDIDVLDIGSQEGEFTYSEELTEGMILDLGHDGEILGIEIIDATRRLQREIAEKVSQRYLTPA